MPLGANLELLGALVTGQYDAAAERLRQTTFDAGEFERFLVTHQLSGCLGALLDGTPACPLLPPLLLASLQRAHEEQRARNECLVGELKRLRGWFQQIGVPFIVLEGPYVAQRFYGGIDRRRFWDLDLLVRPESRTGAGRALHSAGYTLDSRVLLHERLSARFTHAFDYAGPQGRLDLHWALAAHPSYRLDYDALWAERQPYALDGCEFAVLSDEHEIVFSALSCLRDIERGGLRARSLVDLHMILEGTRQSTDWTAFFARRERENVAEICRAVLSVFLHVFRAHASFPEIVSAIGTNERDEAIDRERAIELLEPSRFALSAKRWSWRLHGMSAPALLLWWAVSLPFRVTVHRSHRTRRRTGCDGARRDPATL